MVAQSERFRFGLVHAPLTPFRDGAVDYDGLARCIAFHLANGAEGLAVQTHAGESVSLPGPERKAILEFTLREVAGRAPVVANVSEAGTSIAADLARHAAEAGAAAVMTSVPYYWTPPDHMLVEHFVAIGEAAGLPTYLYNAPGEMGGVKIRTPVVLAVAERLPGLAGVIDGSMDWQFMVELIAAAREIRPDFELVSSTEYLVSAYAIGATGTLSSLAVVAPRLVQRLFRETAAEDYSGAYEDQVAAALLHRAVQHRGVPGLKAAARLMGRDAGTVRPPLRGLDEPDIAALREDLARLAVLQDEPRGW